MIGSCCICLDRPGVGETNVALEIRFPFGPGLQRWPAHLVCIEEVLDLVHSVAPRSERDCFLCGRDAGTFEDLEVEVRPGTLPISRYLGRAHVVCLDAVIRSHPVDITPGGLC